MFKAGDIILVNDYKLRSGQLKNKFLIVLDDDSGFSTLLLSLTTSQKYIQQEDVTRGCIRKGLKHMFLFPANATIGSNEFSFRKDTFVLTINNVIETTEDNFLNLYPPQSIDIKCSLRHEWFFNLVY